MKLKNQFGFSLIEILIAVGILASTVAIIMPQVEVSAMLSVEDNKMLQAVLLASNKMVEIEQQINEDLERGKFPDETSQSGEFEEPFDNYKWEYSFKKVEIPMAGTETEGQSVAVAGAIKNVMKEISKAVREIKLTVSWGGEEDEKEMKTYTLTTHVVNIQ